MEEYLEPLIRIGSLTEAQIKTLRTHMLVREGKISYKDAVRIRGPVSISVGAYYRVLGQARKKLIESLANITLAVILGQIEPSSLIRLIEIIKNIQNTSPDIRVTEALVPVITKICKR